MSAWWASRSSRGLWALLGTETLSLKALGALGLQAISTGGHRGTLAALIQRAVVSMEPAACAASTTRGGGATCSSAFVEALLALVAALVSSAAGWDSLTEVGLVPLLLPLLRDTTPAHVPLVTAAVRILEVRVHTAALAGRLPPGACASRGGAKLTLAFPSLR